MSLCTPLTPRCKKVGGYDPPQLLWMRRPWLHRLRKPYSRNKHDADQMTHGRDITIWILRRWQPAAILNLIEPEIAPFDQRSPEYPTLKPNMKWIGWPSLRYRHSKFCTWEVGCWSVGRYTYLHWSHILLFATERSARGGKLLIMLNE